LVLLSFSFELQLERSRASRTGILKVTADTKSHCHTGKQNVSARHLYAIQDDQ
jgi:hypothetical protein